MQRSDATHAFLTAKAGQTLLLTLVWPAHLEEGLLQVPLSPLELLMALPLWVREQYSEG